MYKVQNNKQKKKIIHSVDKKLLFSIFRNFESSDIGMIQRIQDNNNKSNRVKM